jgi:competence protein ComEC
LSVGLDDIRCIAAMAVAVVTVIYCLPVLPSAGWLLAPLALCLRRRFPGRALVAVVCIVAAWTLISAHHQLRRQLPAAADGTITWVSGRVVGLPEIEHYRTRFQLQTKQPARRLRLSWYGDAPELNAGDCVRLKAKLSTPHGSANPGGYDYEAWLWRRGFAATGYVRASAACDQPPAWRFDRLRGAALHKLAPILDGRPMRGIIEALSLGERQYITQAQWQTLRATGTSHLVAISGLHIGLIAGLLFALVRWLALRSPARSKAQQLASIAAMAGAILYAGLAGWALPTQRALIMAAAFFIAIGAERATSASRALAWAALGVLVWHPASVLAPGFWLSFGAVAWLIWIATFVHGSWWRKAVYFQFGLVIALTPFTLWFFGQASVAAPLVNAVLIPLAGVFVPVVLLAVIWALLAPGSGSWLLVHVAAGLHAGWSVLEWLAHWPLASFHHVLPGPLALLAAMAGLVVLALPLAWRLRVLGLVLILPAVIGWAPSGQMIKSGHFRLTVLDVGQGLASVVRTARHTLVFDAGPAYRTGFDAGAMIVVPYLQHVGRTTVDKMVISHGDMDHIGGAAAIARLLTVVRRQGAGSAQPCRAGQHWRWDGVDFDFVYPNASEAAAATTSNAHSCVLHIHTSRASVLLTGDIEAPGERALVARAGQRARSDVLVVPHHGSATSSSAALLDAVAPTVALVSAGWHNQWDFPRPKVVARYQARNVELFNTATGGALLLAWHGPHAPEVTRWRYKRRRFWQQPRPRGH